MKVGMSRRALLPSLAAIIIAGSVCGRLGDTALAASSADGSYIMMVFNNSVEGKDAEFNDWYDHVHSKEVTSELGWDHAQRFGTAPVAMGSPAPRPYVIVYSGNTSDLAKSYAGYFVAAAKEPKGPQLIRPGTNYNDSLQAIGPEIKGAGGTGQSYLWFVYGNAASGKEEAFNRWFNGDFVKGMAKVPGMVSAQPYVRTEAQLGTSHGENLPPPHLILFRISTNDLAGVMSAAKQTQASLKSETADPASWLAYGFKQLGPIIRP